MPHMANLPWVSSYIVIFGLILTIVCSFSLTPQILMSKHQKKMKKSLQKQKWTW